MAQTLPQRFADVVQEIKNKTSIADMKRLFDWTLGTFSKQYDGEEEQSCITKDTQKFLDGKADFMR